MVLVPENWSHFNQNISTSFLEACLPSFLVSWVGGVGGVVEGQTGQPLLTGWIRPRFNVALLCQTCQGREMDSYCGRSGNRQGWRGGADSRLTAVINHLPHQPDAGWQEGGCWLEWWFVHSLPEMSFCQPVPGQILSVINPSNHLSINFFSRVRFVCHMLHLTVMLRSCRTALLIFSEPKGQTHLKRTNSKCPKYVAKLYLWNKSFLPVPCEFWDEVAERMDYERRVKSLREDRLRCPWAK